MASLQTLKNTFLPGISASQDFFELLRRIERATPEQGRLGTQRDRSHLRLRIIQPADMGFAPREVSDIRQTLNTHQHLAEITISAAILVYLPRMARCQYMLPNMLVTKRWLNVIRPLNILRQSQPANGDLALSLLGPNARRVGHDRASANPFMNHVRQIAGLTPQQALNSHVDRVRRCFPGVYLPGRGSLRKLQEILSLYFSVPIRVEARKGLWIDDSRNIESQRMGRLGNTRIGSRFFDVQHSLVLSIGPVSDPQYLDFQRNSKRINTLVQICHDFVRHRMVLDVQLIIQTSPNMACRLGGGTLSRHSWLKPGSALSIQPIYRTVT